MTRRVFTIEQDKEVARLYLAGLSSIEIAKQYQVDKSSVLGALQRQNVARRIRKASDKVMPYQRKGIMEIAWGGSFQFVRVVNYIYKDATIYLERKKEIADKTKRGC